MAKTAQERRYTDNYWEFSNRRRVLQ